MADKIPRPDLDMMEALVRSYMAWTDHNLAVHLRRLSEDPDMLAAYDRQAFLIAVAERLDPASNYQPGETP